MPLLASISVVVGCPDGMGSTLPCSDRGHTGAGADHGGGTGSGSLIRWVVGTTGGECGPCRGLGLASASGRVSSGFWNGGGRAALGRLGRFANLPFGGGGLRAEAAALNNPAAGRMPTAGRAPRCGGLSSGRSLHALPGVKLPLAVLPTAHRLRAPCARPGRRLRAWGE